MSAEPLSVTSAMLGVPPKLARRGTSNGNAAGSAEARRRRKVWLVATYRANVDGLVTLVPLERSSTVLRVPFGTGEPVCRCYRCGRLLTVNTVTADRIIPGCAGGTYRRDNIRPACQPCNSETGGQLAHRNRKAKR